MPSKSNKRLHTARIVHVGIGGYGELYWNEYKRLIDEGLVELVAIVDPMAERSPVWEEIKRAAIPVYSDLKSCLGSVDGLDLAVIVSPITHHAEHACQALEAGINVLCEKPIAPTVADAERIIQARNRSGKFVEIGFQWCFSDAIRDLKLDVLTGVYGAPIRLSTRVAWPRSTAYFKRNNWAGKAKDSGGSIVNDSPVNNATAHFLFNMLYVLGAEMDSAAQPLDIVAESYRANDIENFDTACCRLRVAVDVLVHFYTTHASRTWAGPVFCYEFEHGRIDYVWGKSIIGHTHGGKAIDYGNPDESPLNKLGLCAQRSLGHLQYNHCSAESAQMHTLCVEAFQSGTVIPFPEDCVVEELDSNLDPIIVVDKLDEQIQLAYESHAMLSELLPWMTMGSIQE